MGRENQTRKRLNAGEPGHARKRDVMTAMKNELRTHVMVIIGERIASPPELAKELSADPEQIRYELKALLKAELAELVFEKPVRGTVEKFYRATVRPRLDQPEWRGVPNAIKGDMRGSLLNIVVEDAVASVEAETYDAPGNAHMSWNPMLVDQLGWERITEVLRGALEETEAIKQECAERLLDSDEKGTSVSVSILAYGSANEARKAGPSDAGTGQGRSPAGEKGSANGKANEAKSKRGNNKGPRKTKRPKRAPER